MKNKEELGLKEVRELLFIQYEMSLRNAGLLREAPTLKEIDHDSSVMAWTNACVIAGFDVEELNERLYKEFPTIARRNCLGVREHHSWNHWGYNEKAERYEIECNLMGCDGFCWVKDVIAQTQPVVKSEGSEHVHAWSKWMERNPDGTTEDGLFYFRRCACGAEEATTQLLPAKIPIMIRGQENWESLLKEALSK